MVHDPSAHQFRVGSGSDAAILYYHLAPGTITFEHTEVPPAWRGQGIAGELARAGLEHARAEGLRVIPLCPFVQAYLRKHPEYQPMVRTP